MGNKKRYKKEITRLQKVLSKILQLKMYDRLSKKIEKAGLTHEKVSLNAGRDKNTFNRDINRMTMMGLDSFLRYFSAIDRLAGETERFDIGSILDSEAEKILDLISRLPDADNIDAVEDEDLAFMSNLKYHFDRLYNEEKGIYKITKEEATAYKKILDREQRMNKIGGEHE